MNKERIKKFKESINIIENEFGVIYSDERGMYVASKPDEGHLPGISITAKTVPEAYELALMSVWKHGVNVKTHYDKPGDPLSKEATVSVEIFNPLEEPRISKIFPGGIEDLEKYRQEVVKGIHDDWINPKEKKWTYTYHERLFNYNPSTNLNADDRGLLLPKGVNQIEKIVEDLKRDITSKGAQAIVWMPTADPGLESNRPCLQRIWFRALEDKLGEYLLNLNAHWRSRDEYNAWFMNVWASTDVQREVAERLSNSINKKVRIGTYRDISDSLHIYGKDFKKFENDFNQIKNNPLDDRVWNSSDFEQVFEEERKRLKDNPNYMKK